jgi:hypothetical protein
MKEKVIWLEFDANNMPIARACDPKIGLKGDKELAELIGPSPVIGSPWHILCFLTERPCSFPIG